MADDASVDHRPDSAPPDTSYRARIRELRDAGAELHALLTALVAGCDQVDLALQNGLAPLDSVLSVSDEAAVAFRRDVHAATTRFEQAMQASRGESYRIRIREGGSSVAELSREMGLSAQMIRRLLRIAEGP
jgi:hypothetical protein